MSQKTVYQAIVAPLLPLLQEEVKRLKMDNYSLSLYFFCMNLCYAIIAGVRSIRLLITEAKTSKDAQEAGVTIALPSQYSEAFCRYDPMIFKRLFFALLDRLEFKSIPEINALGRFILVDGSIFPAIKTMDWASYKKTANGIKLHLSFELNRMIPVQFISSDANSSEKKALQAFLEKGVTYIADRGYTAFKLFEQISNQSAFFIIRVKSNMSYTRQKELTIHLPKSWESYLSKVTDSYVTFKGDKQKKTYRLITFEVFDEIYRITTNRLDLQTHEIIMLYAYRWQIELFFRCVKRCFKSLHLWTHNEKGIEIQFYLYMIIYILLLNFKQRNHDKQEEIETIENTTTENSSIRGTCVVCKLLKSYQKIVPSKNIYPKGSAYINDLQCIFLEKLSFSEFSPHNKINELYLLPIYQSLCFNSLTHSASGSITKSISTVTRTPECGIVTLLGNKLKGIWKIGIHWLKAVKNRLTSPWDIETIKLLNSV